MSEVQEKAEATLWAEKDALRALENARWLAGHVMQFGRKSTVDLAFWAGMIRSSEEFSLRDEVMAKYASTFAKVNFADALEILEGVEAYMNGGK